MKRKGENSSPQLICNRQMYISISKLLIVAKGMNGSVVNARADSMLGHMFPDARPHAFRQQDGQHMMAVPHVGGYLLEDNWQILT